MKHTAQGDRHQDHIVDLESGITTSKNEVSKDIISNLEQERNFYSKDRNGLPCHNGATKCDEATISCSNLMKNSELSVGNDHLSVDKNTREEEKLILMQKAKKVTPKMKSNKKPPKPPRFSKASALDASDLKLIRASELEKLKRVRAEQIKSMKKMKASKPSSSSSSLCAMIFTIVFCCIILFQGLFARGTSNVKFHGSPESSVRTSGFISVQYYHNVSSTQGPDSVSGSQSSGEQFSGSGINGESKHDNKSHQEMVAS